MKYLINFWFWSSLCLFLFLNLIAESFGDLKFAAWAKPCEIPDPTGTEILDPKFECDASRGLSCQVYQQGKLCGCTGALSYDRRSSECRRKVTSACHMLNSEEEYKKQPFNRKCHENAECVIYGGSLLGGKSSEDWKKSGDAKPVCLCKPGYIAAADLSECTDPNASFRLQPSTATFLIMSSIFIRFFF